MELIDLKKYSDGKTDASAAIQALLDRRGRVEICEGEFLIAKPLIIHDDTHLVLTPATTLRVADGANCSLLDNDGLYSRTFNKNIIIEGGVWDGNNVAQKREYIADENQPCDYDKYVSNAFLVLVMRMVHVQNLTVRNLTFKNPTTFAVHIVDAKYFTVENIDLDFDLTLPNMDGIHIQGPARFGKIRNIRGNANDDHVALCTNGTIRSEVTKGAIEDIDIDGIYCDNGYTGVRLLSCGEPLRNVNIRNIHGNFRYYAVSFTHHYPVREDRPILLENIHVSDLYVSKTSEGIIPKGHDVAIDSHALIWFESFVNCKNVLIENVYRKEKNSTTHAPLLRLNRDANLENVVVRNVVSEGVSDPPLFENQGEAVIDWQGL